MAYRNRRSLLSVNDAIAAARLLVQRRDAWLNPADATADVIKKRTLTHLYNERPAWLDTLHARLDAAVSAAYGWPAALTDAEILERLPALNGERTPLGDKAGIIVGGRE